MKNRRNDDKTQIQVTIALRRWKGIAQGSKVCLTTGNVHERLGRSVVEDCREQEDMKKKNHLLEIWIFFYSANRSSKENALEESNDWPPSGLEHAQCWLSFSVAHLLRLQNLKWPFKYHTCLILMVTGEKSESLLSTKVAQLCHLGPGAFSTDDPNKVAVVRESVQRAIRKRSEYIQLWTQEMFRIKESVGGGRDSGESPVWIVRFDGLYWRAPHVHCSEALVSGILLATVKFSQNFRFSLSPRPPPENRRKPAWN